MGDGCFMHFCRYRNYSITRFCQCVFLTVSGRTAPIHESFFRDGPFLVNRSENAPAANPLCGLRASAVKNETAETRSPSRLRSRGLPRGDLSQGH